MIAMRVTSIISIWFGLSVIVYKEEYGGNVFVVFSLDGEIANKEVISQIEEEIYRLSGKYEK